MLLGKADTLSVVFGWDVVRAWSRDRLHVLLGPCFSAYHPHFATPLRSEGLVGGWTWTIFSLVFRTRFFAHSEFQNVYFQEGDLMSVELVSG